MHEKNRYSVVSFERRNKSEILRRVKISTNITRNYELCGYN